MGMALGALLTRIQLKGMLAKVIREELEKEHSGRERDDGQTKSDAA